ncbi:YciI family protein [Mesorhizobium sp. NPDC059025]|uniref:YciI family protein n=1 Tax=unclassified Mesorhizobium TaxID=325217 RepID=UPI0036AFE916
MKYLCLVYHEEAALRALSATDMRKLDAESLAYDKLLDDSGHLIAAEALQPVKTAKVVRKRKGRVLVTDGPFAETKEQLLGFILVEAEDLEKALALAADIPLAEMGMIEVRAIYDIPQP